MRAITPAERALIAGGRLAVFARCLVTDGDGAWRDVSALVVAGGLLNLFDGATIDTSLDQPVATATVTLRRDADVVRQVGASWVTTRVSIAPTMAASPLNRRGDGSYAPLIDVGRGIRLAIAVLAPGSTPTSGDWRGIFEGVIDAVDWSAPTAAVPLTCRDVGARLLDAQIEVERNYGGPVTIGGTSHTGTPLAVVLRAILDDNGFAAVPLVVDGDPAWELGAYTQTFGNVLTALRDLAAQRGWDVRYRWRGAAGSYGTFDLVLGEPDRAKTTPDLTLQPSEYKSVDALAVNIADVRNAVRVTYTDRATGARAHEDVVIDDSVARYGRRWMELAEDATSAIDTAPEALTLATAAASDLSFPAADQSVTSVGCWPVELGDVVQFPPNSVHYDEAQVLAVQAVRLTLTPGHLEGALRTRGSVAGLYKTWLRKAGPPSPTPPATTITGAIVATVDEGASSSTTVAVDVTAQASGGATVAIERRTGSTTTALEAAAWTTFAASAASPLATTDSLTRPTSGQLWVEYRAAPTGGDPSLPVRLSIGRRAPTISSATVYVSDRGTACDPVESRGVIAWGLLLDEALPTRWTLYITVDGQSVPAITSGTSFGGSIANGRSGGWGTDGGATMALTLEWAFYDAAGTYAGGDSVTTTTAAFSSICLISDPG